MFIAVLKEKVRMKEVYTWLPIEIQKKKIYSLTEFIDFISNIDTDIFYFRGESELHNTRTASIYRSVKMKGISDGFSNNYLFFEDIINDYYQNIGNMIHLAEQENFIAFAQHHGLPTPLLDITTNPMTSLYFSVLNNNDFPGFVYLFDSRLSIDISRFLRGAEHSDFFEKILHMDDKIFVKTIFEGLCDICMSNEAEFFIFEFSLAQHIHHLLNQSKNFRGFDEDYVTTVEKIRKTDFFEEKIFQTVEELFSEEKYKYLSNWYIFSKNVAKEYLSFTEMIKQLCPENYDHNFTISQYSDRVSNYLFMLRMHFKQLNKSELCAYDFHNLPAFPQLIYTPTYLFDRMKAQDGLFFYQLGLHKVEPVYGAGSIETQQYFPKHILEIHNKNEILNQLDKIGVSRKSLFPDVDNIAQYLVKKHKANLKK